MPLVGFTCPPWVETGGRQNTLDVCLRDCANPCVSPLLLNAMWNAEHSNHHKGAYISASMLGATGCMRQVFLERTHDFYEVPVRRWWPFRGTIIHSIIEEAGVGEMLQYGWLQELRMAVPIHYEDMPAPELDENGIWTGNFLDEPLVITLGGTTDGYNFLRRWLHDFKSMADVKVEMFAKAQKGDEKWIRQLNVYRWLIKRTPTPPEVLELFPDMPAYLPEPEQLVVQGIGMMAIPRTGQRFGMKLKKGSYASYQEVDIEPLPLMPEDELETFIRAEVLSWYRALLLNQVPPVVPKSESWLCKNCQFNGELIRGGMCHPTVERDVVEITE